ncbi:FAD-binding oxidoreductase [Halobacillus litoralis]|uniref:FAD-binding oxidoreductase n=1 Tax=Halobacillus litoralis TaxID=45668 RepID=UPI001CFD7B69|nr:FAD-binding oxidoreductase [Halobacillus litoralis]
MKSLSEVLTGEIVVPEDDKYEETRAIFNAGITKRPAGIVVCKNEQDVIEALRFAKEQQMEISVRGGGHHVAGYALNEGGIMIDLSQMTDVSVDEEKKVVNVQGGATLADIDHETQKYGLAMPTGTVSETGIAGLALSGGFGYLRGKLGLSCDQMIGATLITADGNVLKTSDHENADLFWALRGGGGSFGIVTEFEFQLHEIGPEVLAFDVMYDLKDGQQVFRELNKYLENAPDEVSVNLTIMDLPPEPMLPEFLHYKSVMVVAGMYSGSPDEGKSVVGPLRELAQPIIDNTDVIPYVDLQKKLDPMVPHGQRFLPTSLFFEDLSEEVFEAMMIEKEKAPGPLMFQLWENHGEVNQIDVSYNAFAVRNSKYLLLLDLMYTPEQEEAANQWIHNFYTTFKAQSINGAAYLNGIEADDQITESTYGENYQRLLKVKEKYDPENIFHNNPNIHINAAQDA